MKNNALPSAAGSFTARQMTDSSAQANKWASERTSKCKAPAAHSYTNSMVAVR